MLAFGDETPRRARALTARHAEALAAEIAGGPLGELRVHFRPSGHPPRTVALAALLNDLRAEGLDPCLLRDVAAGIARDGYYVGHHNYRRFAVFLPVGEHTKPA